MCAVSAISDYYKKKFEDQYTWPWDMTNPLPPNPITPLTPFQPLKPEAPKETVSKEEFDKLKEQVEEMKRIIEVAKKYDEDTHQHDCEMEDKVDFIKKLAKYMGVNLGNVFDDHK